MACPKNKSYISVNDYLNTPFLTQGQYNRKTGKQLENLGWFNSNESFSFIYL